MKNVITPFKIGDKIKVITGKQKGLIGTISFINHKKEQISLEDLLPRVISRKSPQSGESKEVKIQALIHVSNVMLWDKNTNACSRIGYKMVEGQKRRYFKKSGNFI
jgi:large subunit ribosomal protein L24